VSRGGARPNTGRKGLYDYIIGKKRYYSLREAATAEGVSVQSISNWCSDVKGRPDCRKELKGSAMPGQSIFDEAGPEDEFDSAFDYLKAVTCGKIKPDTQRINAAKAVLPYETPIRRIRPESLPPKALRRKEAMEIERNKIADFQKRAALIRAKHNKELSKNV